MAHFAELNENNVVIRVLAVSNEVLMVAHDKEDESLGIALLKQLYGEGTRWVQTSYNGSFRRRYAGVGMLYNEELGAFISSRPYPSWRLDESGDWQAPVQKPDPLPAAEKKRWIWDEESESWIAVPFVIKARKERLPKS